MQQNVQIPSYLLKLKTTDSTRLKHKGDYAILGLIVYKSLAPEHSQLSNQDLIDAPECHFRLQGIEIFMHLSSQGKHW